MKQQVTVWRHKTQKQRFALEGLGSIARNLRDTFKLEYIGDADTAKRCGFEKHGVIVYIKGDLKGRGMYMNTDYVFKGPRRNFRMNIDVLFGKGIWNPQPKTLEDLIKV